MSKWTQDQYARCNISKIEKKIHQNPHYIPQHMNIPLIS